MQNIIVSIGYAEAELAGRARTLYYWLSFSRPVGRVSILERIATMMTPITYLEVGAISSLLPRGPFL